MLKKLMAVSAAFAVFASVAMADGAPAKLTEVRTCPMTHEKVDGDGAGSEVFEHYKVYFCCGGCQPAFDKLSKAEKEKKIAEVLKK